MTLKYAQDVLVRQTGGNGDFNARILGHTYNEVFGYPNRPTPDGIACFDLADRMVRDGRLYAVQRFKHTVGDRVCSGHAFPYGGTWVCNTCKNSNINKPWWKVKTYKDGTAWCCVGPCFIDLQASDNFAFGDTREEALANYEALMLSPHARLTVEGMREMKTDKRDEALIEDIAQYFDMLRSDSEAMAARGLQKRENLIRASVWKQAAEDVRSIKLT